MKSYPLKFTSQDFGSVPGTRHRTYRRYRRYAFGDSAKHSEQYRRLVPPAVARFPENSGLSGQSILENILVSLYNESNEKTSKSLDSEVRSFGPRIFTPGADDASRNAASEGHRSK
jgi:hypothetical protein